MAIIQNPYSMKSKYVKLAVTSCKLKNKYHIEEYEETIKWEDFWTELLNIIEEERKNRQGK
jgi:hypothetical protein